MNLYIFSGRLTQEPEMRRTQEGTAVCSIGVAIEDGYKDKKRTFFPTLVLWRKNAEFLTTYARKGDLIEGAGRYTERKWIDKEGRNRVSVEIVVDTVKLIAHKHSADGQESPPVAAGALDGHGYPGGSTSAWPEIPETEDSSELPF